MWQRSGIWPKRPIWSTRSTIMELGALSRYERLKLSLTDYHGLFGQEAAS